MALKFHPEPGTVLICDYGDDPLPPEMRKRRPVIVVSPKFKRRTGLCTVVPLSTTAPDVVEPYHTVVKLDPPLPKPFHSSTAWAKCDMISAVSFARLDLIAEPRGPDGRRQYRTGTISNTDLKLVLRAIVAGLGIPLGR